MTWQGLINGAWFAAGCWLIYYGTGSAASVFGVLILAGLAVLVAE